MFGALLAPAALSLLTTTFPDGRDRARAFGVFAALAGSGAAIGLLLGGALTAVRRLALVHVRQRRLRGRSRSSARVVLLPAHRPRERPRLDLAGTVTASRRAVLHRLRVRHRRDRRLDARGWSTRFLAGGVVLLGAFVRVQRRVAAPLLPLRVLLDRNRGGSFLTILVLTTGMFAVTLFLAYVLQQDLGFSPVMTGVAMLPMVAAIMSVSTTMPALLLPRVGPKPLIITGLLLGPGALFWFSFLSPGSSYAAHVLGPLILMGLGMGTAMSTSINTATLGVAPQDAGVASASVNTMQQVGGSVGTALLSSIAGTATAAALAVAGTSPRAATLAGYDRAFVVASVIFLVGAVVCGSLVPAGRPHATPASGARELPRGGSAEGSWAGRRPWAIRPRPRWRPAPARAGSSGGSSTGPARARAGRSRPP